MAEELTKEELRIKMVQNEWESKVGRFLSNLHRGYHWGVDVKLQPGGGIVNIRNLTLHGEFGFVIHMRELIKDPTMNVVMRAAGELLERCGLPATHRPKYLNEDIKRDVRNNMVGVDDALATG